MFCMFKFLVIYSCLIVLPGLGFVLIWNRMTHLALFACSCSIFFFLSVQGFKAIFLHCVAEMAVVWNVVIKDSWPAILTEGKFILIFWFIRGEFPWMSRWHRLWAIIIDRLPPNGSAINWSCTGPSKNLNSLASRKSLQILQADVGTIAEQLKSIFCHFYAWSSLETEMTVGRGCWSWMQLDYLPRRALSSRYQSHP